MSDLDAINAAFDAAKVAGKRSTEPKRERPWQTPIEIHERPITEGTRVVNEQSADGRVRYEFQRHGKQIELRRVPAKVRGKAHVKAAKRARQHRVAAAQHTTIDIGRIA